ncbi:MAG: hypothetical protein QXP27_04665 [Candidatus Methanomethyliaceae archaeon]
MTYICRRKPLLILFAVLGLGLFACNQYRTGGNISPLRSPLISPAATESFSLSLEVPTPSPGFGVVRGRLVAVAPSARAFLAGDIYLAPVIYTQGSTPIPFVRVKTGEDPKANLRNQANEFAIVDVPPGKYGIVLHTPVSDYVVSDEAGGFLIIEVREGEVLDLGVVELR